MSLCFLEQLNSFVVCLFANLYNENKVNRLEMVGFWIQCILKRPQPIFHEIVRISILCPASHIEPDQSVICPIILKMLLHFPKHTWILKFYPLSVMSRLPVFVGCQCKDRHWYKMLCLSTLVYKSSPFLPRIFNFSSYPSNQRYVRLHSQWVSFVIRQGKTINILANTLNVVSAIYDPWYWWWSILWVGAYA